MMRTGCRRAGTWSSCSKRGTHAPSIASMPRTSHAPTWRPRIERRRRARAVDRLDAEDIAHTEGRAVGVAVGGIGVHRQAGDRGARAVRVVEAEGVPDLVGADVCHIHGVGVAVGRPVVVRVVLGVRLDGNAAPAVVPRGGHGDRAACSQAHPVHLVDEVLDTGGRLAARRDAARDVRARLAVPCVGRTVEDARVRAGRGRVRLLPVPAAELVLRGGAVVAATAATSAATATVVALVGGRRGLHEVDVVLGVAQRRVGEHVALLDEQAPGIIVHLDGRHHGLGIDRDAGETGDRDGQEDGCEAQRWDPVVTHVTYLHGTHAHGSA